MTHTVTGKHVGDSKTSRMVQNKTNVSFVELKKKKKQQELAKTGRNRKPDAGLAGTSAGQLLGKTVGGSLRNSK